MVREMARIREDIHRVLKGKQDVDRETQGGLGKVRGALHSNGGGRKLPAGRPRRLVRPGCAALEGDRWEMKPGLGCELQKVLNARLVLKLHPGRPETSFVLCIPASLSRGVLTQLLPLLHSHNPGGSIGLFICGANVPPVFPELVDRPGPGSTPGTQQWAENMVPAYKEVMIKRKDRIITRQPQSSTEKVLCRSL